MRSALPDLRRALGLPTVIAAAAGLALSASSLVVEVQVAQYMLGDSAWIAIVIAGLLCLLAGLCFAELNVILPSASGTRLYFAKAYGDSLSLAVSLFYVFALAMVVGVEGNVLSKVLREVVPAVPPLLWVTAMLAVVVVMNIRGIKTAGRFQDLLTYGMAGTLLVMAVIALARNGLHLSHPLTVGSPGNLLNAVAVAVFLFVGFEWVVPLAEEVMQVRHISSALLICIGILNVIYGLFTEAMTSTVPRAALMSSGVPQILFARTLLGTPGVLLMVAMTVAASFGLFNAGLLTVSRFIYATAREHALPSTLSRLSKHMTPWVAIVLMGAVTLASSAVVFLTGRYMVLVDVGAAIESVVYALVGLAVVRLRRTMPDAERPFRVPGRSFIPLTTLVVFALLALAVLSQDVIAALYVVVGMAVFAAYVRWVVPGLRLAHRDAGPSGADDGAIVPNEAEPVPAGAE